MNRLLKMLLMLALFQLALSLRQEQTPMDTVASFKVAGRNPFHYCSDPNPYTLQIAYIDLTPQDPADWRPGQNITIEIDGHNQQIIEKGALVDISFMQRDPEGDWKPLSSKQLDLCLGLWTIFDHDCPVRSGVSTEIRNITIPPEIPPGVYLLVIDGHTKFEERITCIHAMVPFLDS